MISFPHLAQRVFNRPVAILPEKAEIIMAALAERLGVTHLVRLGGEPVPLKARAFYYDDEEEERDPYERARGDKGYDTVAGVAIVPVTGTLVQKTGRLRPYSGMTGYDGIRQNVLTARHDPDVRAIVLDVNSPGGEVAGCFDLVDTLFAARGEKPIWAILDEDAYSAAYAIASAADRIVVPRTGGTGSVGVITMHVDFTQMLGQQGVAVTMIRYGRRKAEGNPYEALSDETLAAIQRDIDTMGELFVETVARNRNLAAAKVRDTEAATFLGAEGVTLGLADAVMAPDAAFRALLAELEP